MWAIAVNQEMMESLTKKAVVEMVRSGQILEMFWRQNQQDVMDLECQRKSDVDDDSKAFGLSQRIEFLVVTWRRLWVEQVLGGKSRN